MIGSFLEKVVGGYNLDRWRSFLPEHMTEENVERRNAAWGALEEQQGVWGVWCHEEYDEIRLKGR